MGKVKNWLIEQQENGMDEVLDGTKDIIQGRYEVCRELLHYIRSIGGEEHDELDTD